MQIRISQRFSVKRNAVLIKDKMEKTLMNLKILLPFQVFDEIKNVRSIVIETSEGSYGLLPQRLDCVAALVPGIFTYETERRWRTLFSG